MQPRLRRAAAAATALSLVLALAVPAPDIRALLQGLSEAIPA